MLVLLPLDALFQAAARAAGGNPGSQRQAANLAYLKPRTPIYRVSAGQTKKRKHRTRLTPTRTVR
jgi:hypothetical protein